MPEDSRLPFPKHPVFEVRKARPADIDAVVQLEADSFASDQLSRRSFQALAKSPSSIFLVICEEEKLIGYAIVLLRRHSRSARLYSIAVRANDGGRGVGSLLLSAAETAALRRSAGRLRLEVRMDNAPAIRFYHARGYREIGQRPGYYADGMDALLLARDLSVAAGPLSSGRLSRAA